VSRVLDVPVSKLPGERKRDRVPVGWWFTDMPAEDWIHEAELAIERGYTAVKLKGRPWFDVQEGVAELCEAIPEWFTVGIDFNRTMRDAERALPILRELDRHDQVELFESPIPQDDIEGNRKLVRELDADVAQHNGRPESLGELTQLQTGIAEAFVLGTGGPERLKRESGMAEHADIPFWIQNLGMLTAVFWIHVCSTMSHNRLPNVFCNHLFETPPLTDEIVVEDGTAAVPDGPGLGFEPDFEVVEDLRTERQRSEPEPDRVVVTKWPDREPMYFASGSQMTSLANDDEFPYFERGVTTRLVSDDGSKEWDALVAEVKDGPVVGERAVGGGA
jgi:L-alanine-DL-glutamate epimerase-like enolase superfamily enzyme